MTPGPVFLCVSAFRSCPFKPIQLRQKGIYIEPGSGSARGFFLLLRMGDCKYEREAQPLRVTRKSDP